LFKSRIHPKRKISTLTNKDLKQIFKYIPLILNQAIKLKGTTFDTYRTPDGNPGLFIKYLNVYGRKNLTCKVCKTKIQSIKINGRSSYFCNHCQK
jgi:formamidopyrimidine-DNA glycosylase